MVKPPVYQFFSLINIISFMKIMNYDSMLIMYLIFKYEYLTRDSLGVPIQNAFPLPVKLLTVRV